MDEPTIEAKVREHRSILGEIGGGTPTALDGLVLGSHSVLTIESKFTEPEFGRCGQTQRSTISRRDIRFDPAFSKSKAINCTGDHAVGSDLKSTTAAHSRACRLTVQDGGRKPRRYWDIAPDVFKPELLEPGRRCPFATDAYQLMRNVCFAHEWAKQKGLADYGFLVLLVDGSPKAAVLRARVDAFRTMLLTDSAIRIGVTSYEDVAGVLEEGGETTLARWLRRRIRSVFP